jgi:hypothetical protein
MPLDAELRESVRRFVFKLVVPTGIIATIVAGFGGWFLKDYAYNRAHAEAYAKEEAKIAEIEKKIGEMRDDVVRAKTQAEAANGEAATQLKEIQQLLADSRALKADFLTLTRPDELRAALQKQLLQDPDFVASVGRGIDSRLDLVSSLSTRFDALEKSAVRDGAVILIQSSIYSTLFASHSDGLMRFDKEDRASKKLKIVLSPTP